MSRKRTIEMDAYELEEMKAQEEQMKLSLSEMADELESTKEELETAKGELKVVTKDLRDTRFLLRSSVELQQRAEESAKMCEDVLRGFLNQWLTVENRAMVKNILRFYRPFQRINMINALEETKKRIEEEHAEHTLHIADIRPHDHYIRQEEVLLDDGSKYIIQLYVDYSREKLNIGNKNLKSDVPINEAPDID